MVGLGRGVGMVMGLDGYAVCSANVALFVQDLLPFSCNKSTEQLLDDLVVTLHVCPGQSHQLVKHLLGVGEGLEITSC